MPDSRESHASKSFRLLMLGGLSLVDDRDREVGQQKRRLALLALLASARGRGMSRDKLVAYLSPESTTDSARHALQQLLYYLRLQVGETAFLGTDPLRLDPTRIGSDLADFESALERGDLAHAVSLYRGPLLDGFHLDSAEFEEWLDTERRRLAGSVCDALVRLAGDAETRGDLVPASQYWRRLASLDPDDPRGAAGVRRAAAASGNEVVQAPRAAPQTPPVPPLPQRRRRPIRAAALLIGAAALGVAALLPRRTGAGTPRVSILLASTANRAGTDADYLASDFAGMVARRLRDIAGLEVRAGMPSSDTPSSDSAAFRAARRVGAGNVLLTELQRTPEGYRVRARIIDATRTEPLWSGEASFDSLTVSGGAEQVAIAAGGVLLRRSIVPNPPAPGGLDPESYRLALRGDYLGLRGRAVEALADFDAATRLDPRNAKAWAGIAAVWRTRARTGRAPAAEAYAKAEQAAQRALALDSLVGSAWATLGTITVFRDGDLARGTRLIERGISAEPANPELHWNLANLLQQAWQWDRALAEVRLARQLDPLSGELIGQEANIQQCVGNFEEALRLNRELLQQDSSGGARRGVVRDLAQLGRWDEALAARRVFAERARDTLLLRALDGARGEAGYWAFRHIEGKVWLGQLTTRRAAGEYVDDTFMAQAHLAAGELDQGLTYLEAMESRAGVRSGLLFLQCSENTDEVRSDPRFLALLARSGRLRPSPPG